MTTNKGPRKKDLRFWVPTLSDAIAAQLAQSGGGIPTKEEIAAIDSSDELSAAIRLALRTHGMQKDTL